MPPVQTRRRTADRLIGPLLGMLFVRGRAAEITPITPRMRLIRLAGPELRGLSWTPGQQVRVRATDPLGGSALRTYSVWSYREDQVELCVLDHGDGPGARWARGLRAGDEVLFRKPEGTFVVRDAALYHLFAGEETACVAFGPMLGALPPDARVHGAIEVPGRDDCLPVPRSAELTWCFRGDTSAAASAGLSGAIRDLDLPAEPGVAYLAGEARTCQAVRRHLVAERGWPRRSVLIKPFWAPGKRGMELGKIRPVEQELQLPKARLTGNAQVMPLTAGISHLGSFRRILRRSYGGVPAIVILRQEMSPMNAVSARCPERITRVLLTLWIGSATLRQRASIRRICITGAVGRL